MIRRPPRSTLDRSSAASDVYKRQTERRSPGPSARPDRRAALTLIGPEEADKRGIAAAVSYTHLRAHETVLDLVCRLLLENKKHQKYKYDADIVDPTTKSTTRTTPPYNTARAVWNPDIQLTI